MGYEIWGFLVMLTYNNDVRKIKMRDKNMGISFKNPQISYIINMYSKVLAIHYSRVSTSTD